MVRGLASVVRLLLAAALNLSPLLLKSVRLVRDADAATPRYELQVGIVNLTALSRAAAIAPPPATTQLSSTQLAVSPPSPATAGRTRHKPPMPLVFGVAASAATSAAASSLRRRAALESSRGFVPDAPPPPILPAAPRARAAPRDTTTSPTVVAPPPPRAAAVRLAGVLAMSAFARGLLLSVFAVAPRHSRAYLAPLRALLGVGLGALAHASTPLAPLFLSLSSTAVAAALLLPWGDAASDESFARLNVAQLVATAASAALPLGQAVMLDTDMGGSTADAAARPPQGRAALSRLGLLSAADSLGLSAGAVCGSSLLRSALISCLLGSSAKPKLSLVCLASLACAAGPAIALAVAQQGAPPRRAPPPTSPASPVVGLALLGGGGSVASAIVQRLAHQSAATGAASGPLGGIAVEAVARLLGQPIGAGALIRAVGPSRGLWGAYAIAALVIFTLSEDSGPLWEQSAFAAFARMLVLSAMYAVETCTTALVAARHGAQPAGVLSILHALQGLLPALALDGDLGTAAEAAAQGGVD